MQQSSKHRVETNLGFQSDSVTSCGVVLSKGFSFLEASCPHLWKGQGVTSSVPADYS